jgi:hypothetical protein
LLSGLRPSYLFGRGASKQGEVGDIVLAKAGEGLKGRRPFVGDCKAGPATPPGKSGPRETNVEFLLHAVPFYSLIASRMKWPDKTKAFKLAVDQFVAVGGRNGLMAAHSNRCSEAHESKLQLGLESPAEQHHQPAAIMIGPNTLFYFRFRGHSRHDGTCCSPRTGRK